MGGIIMGAIGGLGDAAANVGSTMLKNELDTESRLKIGQQDSDLALQRAKALEDYKVHTANSQREQQVARDLDGGPADSSNRAS
jgi:3-hydroxyisobutyrate dehydrogenase-like beta-hydroxyacid dehydrogenase